MVVSGMVRTLSAGNMEMMPTPFPDDCDLCLLNEGNPDALRAQMGETLLSIGFDDVPTLVINEPTRSQASVVVFARNEDSNDAVCSDWQYVAIFTFGHIRRSEAYPIFLGDWMDVLDFLTRAYAATFIAAVAHLESLHCDVLEMAQTLADDSLRGRGGIPR